jgi:hypothetical protein
VWDTRIPYAGSATVVTHLCGDCAVNAIVVAENALVEAETNRRCYDCASRDDMDCDECPNEDRMAEAREAAVRAAVERTKRACARAARNVSVDAVEDGDDDDDE